MAAAIARMRQQQRPTKANGNVNHAPRQQQNNDGHGHSHVFDEWSAHVRYFLAQYPLDARPFVAQVWKSSVAARVSPAFNYK